MQNTPTIHTAEVSSSEEMMADPDPNQNTNLIQQTSYNPQFSSATALILSRLKGCVEAQNSDSLEKITATRFPADGNKESPRDSGLGGTLSFPIPEHANGQRMLAAAEVLSAAKLRFAGLKRKRGPDYVPVDFAQSTISLPMPDSASKPMSLLVPPAKRALADSGSKHCGKCKQKIWALQNTIVVCSLCAKYWHRSCVVSGAAAGVVVQAIFTCTSCLPTEKQSSGYEEGDQYHQIEIDKLRQKKLADLPQGVVPAKTQLVGFGAGHASDSARIEYFSGKTRTELLNILSFCDQLHPQLLTDVLVSVSKKHPELPMFDSPTWNAKKPAVAPTKPHPVNQVSRQTGKPRNTQGAVDIKAKHKHKSAKKIVKAPPLPQAVEEPPEESRGSLPPTWPRAGNGLYAKLRPEHEDRAFLLDENDDEAFSHFRVDKSGKQVALSA